MKKGNRVLAMFLAAVMLVTSIAWDFGNVEATETETTNPAYLEYDFENMTDVSVLEEDFESWKQAATEKDASIADYWFLGKTAEGADSSEVGGLKVKERTPSSAAVYRYLKHKNTYTNFHVTVELYPDANTYVNIGHEPDDGGPAAGNSDAFMLWFSSTTQGNWRGGGKTQESSNAAGYTFKKNTPYTFHIRVENGVFSAWFDEIGWSTSFNIGTAFESPSSICLRQRRNYDSATSGGFNGGFKSLTIRDLDVSYAEGYFDFENVNTTALDEVGFQSTQYDKATTSDTTGYAINAQDQTVGTHWFSGKSATIGETTYSSSNIGLKSIGTEAGKTAQLLTTPYTYNNFELSTEIYYGVNTGVVLGTKNAYPRNHTDYSALAIYFANNRIQLDGALNMSSAEVTGTDSSPWDTWTSSSGTITGFFYFNGGNAMTANQVYTLNIRMQMGVLTVWVDGYDSVLTIEVADHYRPEIVSLMSHRYDNNGGGFKSFAIQEAKPDSYEFDFMNADMNDLSKVGYTSTLFSSRTTSTLVGEAEQDVENHWFTGEGEGTPYENPASTVTSKTLGLKTRSADADKQATVLNVPCTYDDYIVSVDVHLGYAAGIILGPKNTIATTSSTDAIKIYFANNQVQINGAGTGGSTKTFKPGSTNITWYTTQTLNVKMENGVLTVWVNDSKYVTTINMPDTFQPGNIGLIAYKYDGDGGGFEHLKIQNLDAESYTDFNNIDASTLTDKGYTSTKFSRTASDQPFVAVDGEIDTAVSTHWTTSKTISTTTSTSSHCGIKPVGTSTDERFYLNTPYTYENFEASVGTYFGTYAGIAFGTKNEYAGSTSSSTVYVYFANGKVQINGAVDLNDYKVSGETGWYSVYNGETGMFCFNYDYETKANVSATEGTLYTLNVKVLDGIMTIWVDDYDAVVELALSQNYQAETIALAGRRFVDGGFYSFQIEELEGTKNLGTTVDVDGYTDFDKVNVAVLDEKGFTATRFDKANGYTLLDTENPEKTVGTYWATGGDVPSRNDGLKPNNHSSENVVTFLNTPYQYEDFRISTEVYWGGYTGVVLGAKNVYPQKGVNSAVSIYFNQDQIQISGEGVELSSAVVTNGAVWSEVYAPTGIFKPSSDFAVTAGEIYDLNVEMKDGTLTVWVTGWDGMLSINTKTTFVNESIALMALQYDGTGGGFKSLTVEELTGDLVQTYTAEQFATYRSSEGYTAPTYKNYLFAGWFTDSTCALETAIPTSATTVEEETVYAKFVPRYILTVKAQVSAELLDTNLQNDETGSIRFATTVDTLNYAQVGFNVSYDKDGDGEATIVPSVSNEVYSALKAIGGITYLPTDFCRTSQYFKACTVRNIGESYYGLEFTVTPFWKTLDGTVVEGDTVVKTINQGVDSKFLDGKTALFVGDSIQNGANFEAEGTELLAWYQRLARYGMVTQEVANKGAALTNTATSGTTQIVKQLDNAEVKDSYDFVILEGGVNDVLIDEDVQSGTDITIDWGTINEDPNATFSDDNIAGAMQDLIVKTQEKFPDATIVYLINHYFRASDEKRKDYVAMVKAACRVHGISYVDLSDTEAYPSLEPLSYKGSSYIPDNLHPNAAGYDLSTPVIATHLRKMVTGQLVDTVYVASTGTDKTGYGTADAPYATLNYAVAQVDDGGTIYVQDTLTCTNGEGANKFSLGGYGFETDANVESDTNKIEKVNHKQVTIAGATTEAKLDFSSVSYVFLNESVILEDIQVAWPALNNLSRIMAEGNTFIIKESMTQVGSVEPILVAGSHYHSIEKTDLRVYGGTYKMIVGGQIRGFEVGETNVVVGGKVNEAIDLSDHTFNYVLYGGCYSEGGTTKVGGDTHVTVETGAKFRYVYGGGAKTASAVPTVDGETYVNVTGGNVMSVFGGGYKIPSGSTNVKITGGTIDQVFGGSESASVTGNTNVQLLGGEITRRVYGGSYNDFNKNTLSWVTTDCRVIGHTNVTIGNGVKITFTSSDEDRGVFAGSRYKTAFDDEKTTVIFLDGCCTSKESLLGRDSNDYKGLVLGSPNEYDYLVDATAGGTVTSADGILTVTPNSGYTATVEGATVTAEGATTYTLPTVDGTITVTFSN